MPNIGFVAIDTDGKWIGGRYYLQHLIKSVAALPEHERMPISDVWWQRPADPDPFAEVRDLISSRVVLAYPPTVLGRARRKLRRIASGTRTAADLFQDAGIGALFPVLPCESPGVPYVFWLPDFQYLHLPELFGEELCQWYERYYSTNVSLADLVIVSSRHCFRDYQRAFPEAASKARIVPFASIPDPSWWRLDPESLALSKNLTGPFFLLSNQFSHHKNHMVVFQAVQILKQRGVDVRVVCSGSTYGFRGGDYFGHLQEFLKEQDLRENIRILGLLPRDEHAALMRRSIAMLQPSRFEGWSTTVEDAKALGKTLLVSGIEVHREQLGPDYPLYLDVDDPEAWARAMLDVWSSRPAAPDLKNEADAAGYVRAAQLQNGRAFLAAMHEAMGLAPPETQLQQ
jgi:glycosyltransferase involved in cell wall biosynthesis